MLGGAAYSYPKYFLKNYPEADIDVVEIDPAMTRLAKKYFNLPDNPRLGIFHEDARTFLNKTNNKYDVIYGDAFTSRLSVPYQLTTREAVQKMYHVLNDGGVALINMASAIEGERGKLLRAEYATYKSVFPQVFIFRVRPTDGFKTQNIMLLALRSERAPEFKSDDQELNGYLGRLWDREITADMPILTDDYAPVDYYIMQALRGMGNG